MDSVYTKWKIEPSLKYDACCFLNILTADTFYLTYYQKVYDEFKPKLTPEVTGALSSLKKKMREDNGIIISANLCLYFSAVEDSTIEQMISTLKDLKILKTNFEKTFYYDKESWNIFESVKPELITIFEFLQSIDFENYWRENVVPIVQKKIEEIKPDLPKYDVIKENEHYLGFDLPSNEITVYMLYYSKPHGIKITGTRFFTDAGWPFDILLTTAVHEMMHPPYDYKNDEELRKTIELFKTDEFLMDKVLNHNPSFGYNSLEGLWEEDCVQSLDQIINEKFGILRDAKKRWKENDDGIHVLAIALYQIMKEQNYNDKNEVFRDFLLRIVNEGILKPGD
ncbi:MAG: hypothetical protein M3R36_06955 [Bacteroidota bacterium]|nr:hypothetical protein [Bacteroidota bacterium]